MQSHDGKDKRATPRSALTTFCPTTFTHHGEEHHAMMTEVSENGAKFRLSEHGKAMELPIGDTLAFSVKTPYGLSTCEGELKWARHLGDYYTWGIEFTSLSPDPDDPLRALLDSSL